MYRFRGINTSQQSSANEQIRDETQQISHKQTSKQEEEV